MTPPVTRREFVDTYSRATLDPSHLPHELDTLVHEAKIDPRQLDDIAGTDKRINSREEVGRLYDLLFSGKAAKGDDVARKEVTRIGAPNRIRLELANPLDSASAHASLYAAVPRALGFGLDKFAEKYPALSRNFAGRFLEMSMVVGGEVPFMVASHEYGHYRPAKGFGGDPQVKLTGWANGITSFNFGPGITADQRTITGAAGVNQEQLNGGYLYRDWSLAGSVSYAEAMGYLLAQTNTALYAARTTALTNPPAKDDIAAYVQRMNDRGNNITSGQLATIAVLSDLASAPVWASLIGSGRFLANGERAIEIPKFNLGSNELTFPNFHTLLSTKGPIVGGELFVNPNGKLPLELSMDVRLEDGAVAAGAKLHDLPVYKNLEINPFIRATGSRDPGLLIGADVTVPITSRFSLIGSASYNANDLRGETDGQKKGLNLSINIGISR